MINDQYTILRFLLTRKSECIHWFTCMAIQDAITATSNNARWPPLCQTTYSCSIMTSQNRPTIHKPNDRRNKDGSEIWKLTAAPGFILPGKVVAAERDRKAADGLIFCSRSTLRRRLNCTALLGLDRFTHQLGAGLLSYPSGNAPDYSAAGLSHCPPLFNAPVAV